MLYFYCIFFNYIFAILCKLLLKKFQNLLYICFFQWIDTKCYKLFLTGNLTFQDDFCEDTTEDKLKLFRDTFEITICFRKYPNVRSVKFFEELFYLKNKVLIEFFFCVELINWCFLWKYAFAIIIIKLIVIFFILLSNLA